MNRQQRRAQKKQAFEAMAQAVGLTSCGDCSECCTNLAIDVLFKPEGKRCKHLRDDGCARYATRPDTCVMFFCMYRFMRWPIELRPDKLGVILYFRLEGNTPTLHAIAKDEESARKANNWLADVSACYDLPIGLRVMKTRKTLYFGTKEQTDAIIESKRRLKVINEVQPGVFAIEKGNEK